MKDTELKPCTNCGKMIQSDGTELCCSCYAKWKETLPEENAKLRTRIAELEAYRIDGVSLKTIKAVNESLRLRIAELEKSAIVWHKYPDEKPERPVGFTGMWLNVLTIDECGCTWIGTCRFIGNELDMLAPQTTKYWAYLPEPPREEG